MTSKEQLKPAENKSELVEDLEPLMLRNEFENIRALLESLGEASRTEKKVYFSSYPACNSTA